MKRQQGVALPMVLVILVIVSVSTGSAFNLLQLEQQLNQTYQIGWRLSNQANLALALCEKKVLNNNVEALLADNVSIILDSDISFFWQDFVGGLTIFDAQNNMNARCLITFQKSQVDDWARRDIGQVLNLTIYAVSQSSSGLKYRIRSDYFVR